jgi:hypothetical protein
LLVSCSQRRITIGLSPRPQLYSIPPVRAARTFSGTSGLKASSPYFTHSTAKISHLAGPILTRLISKLCNREQTANKSASYVDEHRTCEGTGTFSVPPVPLGGADAGTLRHPPNPNYATTRGYPASEQPHWNGHFVGPAIRA